jgi:hypothetical protein
MDKRLQADTSGHIRARGNARRVPVSAIGLIAALALAGISMAGEPGCGKRPGKNVIVSDISLDGPRSDEGTTPVFYAYASDGWNRIYARPADVLRTIDDMIAEAEAMTGPGHAPSLRDLAAEISKDLPLPDHTDLGKYALRAPGMGVTVSYVISDLLKRGRVSIGPVQHFMAHRSDFDSGTTSIRMLALGDGASVWSRLYCKGPVRLYYMQYQIP